MAKYAAFGTAFKRGATTIAAVRNVGGPGLALDTEDVTTHDSPGAWEEHVGTILRTGEISLDLIYDPNAATHKNASGGLLADLVSRTAQSYSIVFPSSGSVTWSFSAFVTGYEPTAPVDGALTAAVKLKLTGEPTLA
jgi:predicted secreted protein